MARDSTAEKDGTNGMSGFLPCKYDQHHNELQKAVRAHGNAGAIWMGGMLGTADPELHLFDSVIPETLASVGPLKARFPMAPLGDVYFSKNPDVTKEFKWIQKWCSDNTTTRRWWDFDTMGGCPADMKGKIHADSWKSALEAVPYVHSEIRALEKEGVPTDQIFLAGYSQGGAMAQIAGMMYPKKLAGVMMYLSPSLAPKEFKLEGGNDWSKLINPANKNLDVLYMDAEKDFYIKLINPANKNLDVLYMD